MARIKSGITGPMSGRLGNIVGSSWKGIPYIKRRNSTRTKRVSKDELANRNKFGMAQYWLKPLLKVVRLGFKGYSETVEGFIAAKSWLLKNAMEGTGEDLRINPALVKISHGDLPLSGNISVERISPDRLQFTWDTTDMHYLHTKDQVMMVAYNVKGKYATFNTAGQLRHAGVDTLMAPAGNGNVYLVYAAFIAEDRSRQSNSVYLGEVE